MHLFKLIDIGPLRVSIRNRRRRRAETGYWSRYNDGYCIRKIQLGFRKASVALILFLRSSSRRAIK